MQPSRGILNFFHQDLKNGNPYLDMSHGLTPMRASSTILLLMITKSENIQTSFNKTPAPTSKNQTVMTKFKNIPKKLAHPPHIVRQGATINENTTQLVHSGLPWTVRSFSIIPTDIFIMSKL